MNAKNGCVGWLAVGGGLFVLLLIIGAIGASSSHAPPATHTTSTASRTLARKAAPASDGGGGDACSTAYNAEKAASAALGGDAYGSANHYAEKGLAVVDDCGNDNEALVTKAFLLSMKGLAEHHLSGGDSRTDLNQANALLVECQTRPGLYGTHEAAVCETQEHNNISAQTDWDMQSRE